MNPEFCNCCGATVSDDIFEASDGYCLQCADTEVVTTDCGYGFSAHAQLPNGSKVAYTTQLHPTREQAVAEVRAAIGDPDQ